MVIVVDSDALIALLYEQDNHAPEAQITMEALIEREAELIYPSSVLIEVITTLQGRLRIAHIASTLVSFIQNEELIIVSVDNTILLDTTNYFDIKGSKRNTLFDAVVASVAKNYNADAIFSFDTWYQKKGFRLAKEL